MVFTSSPRVKLQDAFGNDITDDNATTVGMSLVTESGGYLLDTQGGLADVAEFDAFVAARSQARAPTNA